MVVRATLVLALLSLVAAPVFASDDDEVLDADGPAPEAEPEAEEEGGGGDQPPLPRMMIPARLQAQFAIKNAQNQRSLIHEFMKRFSRNMKEAILSDSQGDMPEKERTQALTHLHSQDDDADRLARGEEPAAWARDAPPGHRHHHHHAVHMMNGGEAPPSPQSEGDDAERLANGEEPAAWAEQEAPHPHHHHHAARMMLNSQSAPQPPQRREEREEQPEQEERQEQEEEEPRRSMMSAARLRSKRSHGSVHVNIHALKAQHDAFMREVSDCDSFSCVQGLWARRQGREEENDEEQQIAEDAQERAHAVQQQKEAELEAERQEAAKQVPLLFSDDQAPKKSSAMGVCASPLLFLLAFVRA